MLRLLPCLLATAVLLGGEAAAVPETARKLLDESASAAVKAKQSYDQTLAKEQAKLSAALLKEQEKETKKGNLDGALAIKALLAEVEAGLLQQRAGGQGDLLGEGTAAKPQASRSAPATAASPASLVTDCPLATEPVRLDAPPEELAALLERCVALPLPQGDPKRYQFAASAPGTVIAVTSSRRRFAEVQADLERNGFHRINGGNPEFAWYVLNVKAGDRFSAAGPGDAWFSTRIIAASIRQAR